MPSLLLLPQPGDPLLAVGWTLVYEVYFYAIFTVSMLFARRWLPWILGGWAAATILLHVAFAPTRNPYLYVATNLTNLEFLFGCLIGFLVVHRVIVRPRLLLALSVSALAAVLAYLMATDPATFPSQWFQVGLVAGPMAIALYALVGLELRRVVSIPRWLERTGDGSYSIYLWHVPILAVIGLIVEHVYTSPLVPHIAALLLVFAITVAAGMWLYGLIERPLLRAFRARVFSLPTGRKTWQPSAASGYNVECAWRSGRAGRDSGQSRGMVKTERMGWRGRMIRVAHASVRRTHVVVALVLALPAMACASALAAARAQTPPAVPGLHIDPGSPAGKEYAIPLTQARSVGGGHSLFGAGITRPPTAGGPGTTAAGAGTATGSRRRPRGRPQAPSRTPRKAALPARRRKADRPAPGSGPAVPNRLRPTAPSAISARGDAGIAWMLAAAAAVLLAGLLGWSLLAAIRLASPRLGRDA